MSSTTRGSLRRSGRSPKKALSDYAEGDLVALVRNGTATRARLLELLTASSSPNPRWLIRFEGSSPGQNSKDEEVYEHTFVGKVTTEQPQDITNTAETEDKESIKRAEKNSSPSSDSGSSLSRGTGKNSKRAKNSPPTHQEEEEQEPAAAEESSSVRDDDGGVPSPSASDASATRLSAREARVRRRQAAFAPNNKPLPPQRKSSNISSSHYTTNSINNNNKRKLTGAAKLAAKKKREKEEDCVKIKFLTGTLYLYRGERRRAEFVRRV